jgi:DNA-binding XRE family transcriptional regulator
MNSNSSTSKKDDIPEWYDDELKQILRDQQNGVKPARELTPEQRAQIATKKFLSELHAARLRKHLTQAQLAEKLGVPQSALARIESGKVSPTLKTLARLAEALDSQVSLQRRQG